MSIIPGSKTAQEAGLWQFKFGLNTKWRTCVAFDASFHHTRFLQMQETKTKSRVLFLV